MVFYQTCTWVVNFHTLDKCYLDDKNVGMFYERSSDDWQFVCYTESNISIEHLASGVIHIYQSNRLFRKKRKKNYGFQENNKQPLFFIGVKSGPLYLPNGPFVFIKCDNLLCFHKHSVQKFGIFQYTNFYDFNNTSRCLCVLTCDQNKKKNGFLKIGQFDPRTLNDLFKVTMNILKHLKSIMQIM